MNITRKRYPLITDFSLKGTTLESTEMSTYPRVTIRKDLKWGDPVDKITSKANKTLGLLRRNIKTDNTEVKTRAFNTLVGPILDYSSSVWDPHFQDIDKDQAVQCRRARYVFNIITLVAPQRC